MRYLIATLFLCLFVLQASAARHPGFHQYCQIHYNDAGEASSHCWTKYGARKSARSFRGHHRVAHTREPGRGSTAGLVTVKTAAGIPITVAARAAGNFSGFVAELVSAGYRISFMGGWRAHGSCAGCDMHPRGLAIDINQTARNRVTRALPSGITEMAARHGLTHGAIWRHPDQGHFELAGVHNYARRGYRSMYAHRYHRRHYAAG